MRPREASSAFSLGVPGSWNGVHCFWEAGSWASAGGGTEAQPPRATRAVTGQGPATGERGPSRRLSQALSPSPESLQPFLPSCSGPWAPPPQAASVLRLVRAPAPPQHRPPHLRPLPTSETQSQLPPSPPRTPDPPSCHPLGPLGQRGPYCLPAHTSATWTLPGLRSLLARGLARGQPGHKCAEWMSRQPRRRPRGPSSPRPLQHVQQGGACGPEGRPAPTPATPTCRGWGRAAPETVRLRGHCSTGKAAHEL